MTNNSTRQSNIELLRIVAMFMVLGLHANGTALGLPSHMEIVENPFSSFIRLFCEALCICSVDIFVLISGWFGINATVKGFCKFAYQCLFFSVLVFAFTWALFGFESIPLKTIAGCVFFGKSYWFVKSYALLYILSPILNTFIEHSTKRELGIIAILLLLISVTLGWSDSMPEFKFGYSTISFITLYIGARYVRLYGNRLIAAARGWYMITFCLLSLLLAVIPLIIPIEIPSDFLFSYINPIVILSSFLLLIYFSKLNFQSLFINKIA